MGRTFGTNSGCGFVGGKRQWKCDRSCDGRCRGRCTCRGGRTIFRTRAMSAVVEGGGGVGGQSGFD